MYHVTFQKNFLLLKKQLTAPQQFRHFLQLLHWKVVFHDQLNNLNVIVMVDPRSCSLMCPLLLARFWIAEQPEPVVVLRSPWPHTRYTLSSVLLVLFYFRLCVWICINHSINWRAGWAHIVCNCYSSAQIKRLSCNQRDIWKRLIFLFQCWFCRYFQR